MQRLELNFSSPAEQLAADEALLDWCEAGQSGETLVFWEPRETFVVVGYGNKVASEVHLAACQARNVPVFRRCSGGGAVVQMPGGLNYGLLLRINPQGPTRNISSTNQFVMKQNCGAVQTALGGPAPAVSVHGHTDLAVAVPGASPASWLKVSGNSQRRRRQYLLFHGTLLLNCDLRLLNELLPMPSVQPDYRAHRPHAEFVTNLNLPATAVKAALARAWNAAGELQPPPLDEIGKLAREKYARPEWNYKY